MKIARQAKILELIQSFDVDTQEELAQRLKDENFDVTQATVSRDIREMKLTKISLESGKQKYSTISTKDEEVSEKFIRVFKETVKKIDFAQNMVIIKTLEGMGMAVGVSLDSMKNVEILGTIAGDDTVFCVLKSETLAISLVEKLYKIINSN